MPRFAPCLFALLALLAAPQLRAAENTLTPADLEEGWILLFDGESLYGWEPGGKADWRVADGAICVSSGEKGLLCTTTEFGDYALRLDFRCSSNRTNSGVFLRTPLHPANPAEDCYELNIASPAVSDFPTGSFVAREKADAQVDLKDWHTYEITCRGGRFIVKLDGKQVLDYTDPKPLGRGRIGLQLNEGQVEFRNIKLKPLGMKNMLNGKDLSGWKTDQTKQSVFTVTDKGLHVENGPGQLETKRSYGDFVMQLEVFVNGKELNSGVFFRSIPGDFQNGYEAQIHNGVKPGTDQPNNGGTGGIFRRQKARRVVSKDFEWTYLTIIAQGPHIACWTNGVQVTDWTDTRKPNANPRRGRRLKPGTIILQGHDPTTDLTFRDMRIAEIPPRE